MAFAFGLGQPSYSSSDTLLDCFFPAPLRLDGDDAETAEYLGAQLAGGTQRLSPAAAATLIEQGPASLAGARVLLEGDRPLLAVLLAADTAITDTADAYLKLHLLSHRLALPNSLDLDGIFAHLPNVVWSNEGPLEPAEFPARAAAARANGRTLDVLAVDKFPKMTNYVVPTGVRIADSARVRLGAYLGEGTTVMHEGFLNFNAGALGPNMVEGRISQGVVVGAHSDLGGSSSTMGTLSGGGEIKITVGEQCLIGANAGTGIPLGDRCTIEAGLYITAGTPVTLIDGSGEESQLKARQLAGVSDLLFIRNGANGRIEARSNRTAIVLNEQLHAHN